MNMMLGACPRCVSNSTLPHDTLCQGSGFSLCLHWFQRKWLQTAGLYKRSTVVGPRHSSHVLCRSCSDNTCTVCVTTQLQWWSWAWPVWATRAFQKSLLCCCRGRVKEERERHGRSSRINHERLQVFIVFNGTRTKHYTKELSHTQKNKPNQKSTSLNKGAAMLLPKPGKDKQRYTPLI